MIRLLPIGICLAIVIGSVSVGASQMDELADIRLEETRTPIPGSRTVTLEARKYIVWNEAPTQEAARMSSYRIEIRRAGGAPVALGDYGGSYNIDFGGPAASAVATVRIPRAGRYVISGDPGATARASVVLGKPTRKPTILLAGSAVGALLGIVGTIVAVILAVVLPRKSDKRPEQASSTGDPFDAG